MASKQHQLLHDELLEEYLSQQELDRPTDHESIFDVIEPWAAQTALTESNLEQSFNNDIFSELLDYTGPRPGANEFELLPKQFAETGEGFPDVLLGHFGLNDDGDLDEDHRRVVVELKSPGTDLDKVDPQRLKSPVEQAFEYAVTNGLAVRWVIVTNMEEIRLYHHGSIDHYEEWAFEDFIREGELTSSFWKFYFILHRDYLIGEDGESVVENLLAENLSRRLELTEDFYTFYRTAIRDTYNAIASEKPELADTNDGQLEIIQSSQKLIHRGLVICFFSDHPSRLLPQDLLSDVIETGKELPTLDDNKIYPLLKDLFRVLDTGSTDQYPYDIYGYDGGLFERDEILYDVTLPDELFTQEYEVGDETIEGIYGFTEYDFHTDLNEHVLGRVFEESIGDIEQIRDNLDAGDSPFSGVNAREDYGLYFTREVLTEFVAEKAIQDLLQDKRERVQQEVNANGGFDSENPDRDFLEAYLNEITDIRIADISCGSGAFLVSCFEHLSREARRVFEKLISEQEGQVGLESFTQTEIDILDQSLHGNDILPEAIELSKLSVWIRSARKNTSLGMLTGNFSTNDALAGEIQFEDEDDTPGFNEFDLIIGNPPWGGAISEDAEQWLSNRYSEFDIDNLDTYELFILTAVDYLDDDGRLAFVLPQTLINPDHEGIRTHLLENYTFERYHMLGADWFGPEIRMNTTTLQVRNSEPGEENTFTSMTLVDEDRRQAIDGELNLSQLEAAYSFDIPQSRCIESGEIEPFRYVDDEEIIDTMQRHSIPLGALCESHRGVELNKEGHIIQCPGCGVWLPPPRSTDPGSEKTCTECELDFEYREVLAEEYIVNDNPDEGDVRYIDGDSFTRRYDPLELNSLDLGYDGIKYKTQDFYEGEKVFIRQAGVGLSVAYSGDLVYCPQSVYIYKIRDEKEDMVEWYEDDTVEWADPDTIPSNLNTETYHKFLLGVLNSRIFHYYVFKRFAEIDAAQAFAKLTQTKIRSLPIPISKLSTDDGKELAEEIASLVDEMIDSGTLGGETDWEIEQKIRELYGLGPGDMKYINQQMGLVAYHKSMQELYPDGKPPAPERKDEIEITPTAEAASD